MVKARAWLALGLTCFGTLATTVSCGSDETTGGGTGGGLITAGGTSGAGGGAGSGAIGRGGSGGGSAGGSTAAATTALGAACTADATCGTGLGCFTANMQGDGPPGGLCTTTCKTNADCAGFEAGAGCEFIDDTAGGTGTGFCLEGCAFGDPNGAIKCNDRTDFGCRAFTAGAANGFCAPACNSNNDCGTGLYCDPGSGFCTDTKPTGAATGSPCNPSLTTNTCVGFCLGTSATNATQGTCAELCSLGSPCQYTGTVPGGACLGAFDNGASAADPGAYDLGFCEPDCTCTSDCKLPGEVCRAWASSEQAEATAYGGKGVCYGNVLQSTELTCGGAGGSGAGGASAGSGGTAGASAGSGGAAAGSGGASAGSGGAAAGSGGGANAGSGGAAAGSGGENAGSGGASAGSGGA